MSGRSRGKGGRTGRRPDPEDPSDFTGEDLEGRRLTLRLDGGGGDCQEALSCGSEKATGSSRSSRSESKLPPGAEGAASRSGSLHL